MTLGDEAGGESKNAPAEAGASCRAWVCDLQGRAPGTQAPGASGVSIVLDELLLLARLSTVGPRGEDQRPVTWLTRSTMRIFFSRFMVLIASLSM